MSAATASAKARLIALFEELLQHEGYGSLRVEIRILRKGQKEVILDCGKQYRFVLDVPAADTAGGPMRETPRHLAGMERSR
jgi:hypothetical protein